MCALEAGEEISIGLAAAVNIGGDGTNRMEGGSWATFLGIWFDMLGS